MIAFMSICLAAYEFWALKTNKKTVTEYSASFPEGILVWGWWAVLGAHFIEEMRKRDQ